MKIEKIKKLIEKMKRVNDPRRSWGNKWRKLEDILTV